MFCSWLGTWINMIFPHFQYCSYVLSKTNQSICSHRSCAISCTVILFQIKLCVPKAVFVFFCILYAGSLALLFFSFLDDAVSCPTDIDRSSKKFTIQYLFCDPHTRTLRLCYGTLCAPGTGNFWGKCVWGEGAQVWSLLQFGSKLLFIWSEQTRVQAVPRLQWANSLWTTSL